MSLIMHCEPCGKSFTGQVSYRQHVESVKHMKKVSSLNILSDSNEKKVLNISEILSQGSVEFSSNLLECATCSLKFDSFTDFQAHSVSTEHAKKILEKDQMHLENTKNSVTFIISNSADSNNVKSYSGATSEKSDEILPEIGKSLASFSYCNTCKKSFSGPEPYKQHIASAGHIKKTEQEKKTSLGVNVASEFSCAPCKKTFSGQVPYDQHMNSDIHKKKIQSLQLLEKCEVDSGLKIEKIVLEPGPSNKGNNPLYCKTCDIICSGPAPFQQHMTGTSHLKNLLKAQRQRGINDAIGIIQQMEGPSMQNEDILVPELMDKNKDALIAKLDELITVFSPEDDINFDEQNKISIANVAEACGKIDSDALDNTNFKLAENSDRSEVITTMLNGCSPFILEKENIPEIED